MEFRKKFAKAVGKAQENRQSDDYQLYIRKKWEAMLEEALRGYLVQYLKLDPDNLQLEPEKAMDAYYSSYGPFLPPGGKYGYRFYFGPATVYWDGHTLAVNQN